MLPGSFIAAHSGQMFGCQLHPVPSPRHHPWVLPSSGIQGALWGPAPGICGHSETCLGTFWQTKGGRKHDLVFTVLQQSQAKQTQMRAQSVLGSTAFIPSFCQTREIKS